MMRRTLVVGLPACFGAPWVVGTPRVQIRDVDFTSADGTRLAGSLAAPGRSPPVAAVVHVQGAGATTRNLGLAGWLAACGIAVLTADKRGVRRSGGTYEDNDNVSAANLLRLADDAHAAMAALAAYPLVRGRPRGYLGSSQAGWIVPLAIARLGAAPDFIAFWSGPTCTTSEQLHHQRASAARDAAGVHRPDGPPETLPGSVRYRPDDVDPLRHLTASRLPGLWLFGDRDPYVPVGLCTHRLQAFIDDGRPFLSYRVFPGEGHDLAASPRMASFRTMTDWIRARSAPSR